LSAMKGFPASELPGLVGLWQNLNIDPIPVASYSQSFRPPP
jgi:hypothetical protein